MQWRERHAYQMAWLLRLSLKAPLLTLLVAAFVNDCEGQGLGTAGCAAVDAQQALS